MSVDFCIFTLGIWNGNQHLKQIHIVIFGLCICTMCSLIFSHKQNDF